VDLRNYRTFVFDCDGVILDSNRIKSEAFRLAALPWGEDVAKALVEHHIANGGISRYAKFSYFLDELVPRYAGTQEGPDLEEMLTTFAGHVRIGLESCEVASGLEALRKLTEESRWMIVSGGNQSELREVFAERGIAQWFNYGIFGSPDSKTLILDRELKAGVLRPPAVFLGDSQYDHEAATESGLDFVFVSQWTEFRSWREYCRSNDLRSIHSPKELIEA